MRDHSRARHLHLALELCFALGLALECSPSEFCSCQASCSICGIPLWETLPDCSASLEGDITFDIMRNTTARDKLAAAVDADSIEATCSQLHCELGCLQYCPSRRDDFAAACKAPDSSLRDCGIDCDAPQLQSERELALCLVGQLRGVCKADDFFSLFHVMLADFVSIDAFLVFPNDSCLEDIATFEAAATKWHSDLRVFARCQLDSLDDPAEIRLMEWFKGNHWWVQHWYNMSRWRNNVLSLKHVHYCGREVAKQSKETSYRFVARVRPDAEWFRFPSRLELEAVVPGHILTNFVAMPIQGVAEDSFAIGAPEDMAAYFSLYTDTLLNFGRLDTTEVPWCSVHATLRTTAHCQTVWPENLLEEHLRRQKGLQVQKRKSICFNRIAPCMRGRHHYCTEFQRHARGYLESKLEAFQLLDRDFFLTASGSYADYDTVFAARLVHFFLTEAARLGHPPRVIDMGCGRGSYVEVFRSWGIPVMGVDGNAVILRSIQANGFLWDLTEPLDLRKAFGPQVHTSEACDFEFDEGGDGVRRLGRQLAASSNSKLRLSILNLIPHLLYTDYWPSRHPEGHPEVPIDEAIAVEYLKALCCAEQRCFGFTFTDDGGVLLVWLRVEPEELGEDLVNAGFPIWYQVKSSYFVGSGADESRMYEIDGPSTYPEFQLQYSLMQVQFSTADWVVCLGLGAEIPRMREHVVLTNIVRHAEQGVIISWGTKGRNLRSQDEVLQLFRSRGFALDKPLTDMLQLFSGLAHAPERSDLLVLRRVHAESFHPDLPLELIDEWGGLECQEAGAELRHGLQGHEDSQYGPLGRGRMWASGHCAGLFRAGPDGQPIICGGHTKQWRECILPDEVPGVQGRAIEMDSIEASALYDKADHMVPRSGVWFGEARLNLVFFKVARALAAPGRVHRLQSAWTWLWTTKWEVLLSQPPEEHRVFHPWTKSVQPHVLVWQLGRVALALHQLSCRVRRLQAPEARTRSSWHRVRALLHGLEVPSSNEGVLDIKGAIQPVRALQAEILTALRGPRQQDLDVSGSADGERAAWSVAVEEALGDVVFGDEILPRLWQLFGGEAPSGSGGLGLIPRKAGCADPVFDGVVNVAALWDKESDVGWYLYRLAAIDPTM